MVLLLPLIAWILSAADAAATGDAVLDTTGESVETVTRLYNILPVLPGPGGGVTLSSPNGTCPLSVAQDVVDVSNGFPVLFWPVDSGYGDVVTESKPLNIMFSSLSVCTESSIWKLGDASGANGWRYVMTGGVFGDDKSLFSIEKYGGNYTLVFCGGTQVNGPHMGGLLGSGCGYVGVYSEAGQQWLGLSDEPFLVRFKRTVGMGGGQRKNEI